MSGTPGVSFSALPAATVVSPTDQVVLWQTNPSLPGTTLPARSTVLEQKAPNTQSITPVSGQTVQPNSGTECLLIAGSATLATLTVEMPANPVSNQVLRVKFAVAVTALSWLSPGQTFLTTPPAAAAAGQVMAFQIVGTVWWPH